MLALFHRFDSNNSDSMDFYEGLPSQVVDLAAQRADLGERGRAATVLRRMRRMEEDEEKQQQQQQQQQTTRNHKHTSTSNVTLIKKRVVYSPLYSNNKNRFL